MAAGLAVMTNSTAGSDMGHDIFAAISARPRRLLILPQGERAYLLPHGLSSRCRLTDGRIFEHTPRHAQCRRSLSAPPTAS
jgi:hypothetical protein